jgi:hypothetical protein
LYQARLQQSAEKFVRSGALYQGTTSVVAQMPQNTGGL